MLALTLICDLTVALLSAYWVFLYSMLCFVSIGLLIGAAVVILRAVPAAGMSKFQAVARDLRSAASAVVILLPRTMLVFGTAALVAPLLVLILMYKLSVRLYFLLFRF